MRRTLLCTLALLLGLVFSAEAQASAVPDHLLLGTELSSGLGDGSSAGILRAVRLRDRQRAVSLFPESVLGPVTGEETRTPEQLRKQLRIRRTLMEVHQILSLILWPTMTVASIIGQVNAAQLLQGNTPPNAAYTAHRVTQGISQALYWSSGVVAWAAPPPVRRPRQPGPRRPDSGDAHVLFSLFHGLAMGGLLATGLIQAGRTNLSFGQQGYEDLLRAHTVLGWTAVGFTSAAGIAIMTF